MELDTIMADVFSLDVRVEPSAEKMPPTCSANCTNDGCSAATTC